MSRLSASFLRRQMLRVPSLMETAINGPQGDLPPLPLLPPLLLLSHLQP
jgi:hypothetical protein